MPKGRWDEKLRVFIPGQKQRLPTTLGYESIGRVVEVGPKVQGVKVGDTIWIDGPHQETHIMKGETARRNKLCKVNSKNLEAFGAYARTRVALNAIHDASLVVGETVLIVGLGVVGVIAAQIAQLSGAQEVYGFDINEYRVNFAKKYGVISARPTNEKIIELKKETNGGVDAVIECSGSYEGLNIALKSCKMTGRVVTVSSYGNDARALHLGAEWLKNRLTMLSSMSVNGCPSRRFPLWDLDRLNRTAQELIRNGKINIRDMITHRFKFNEILDAYSLLEKEEAVMLVLIGYGDGRK